MARGLTTFEGDDRWLAPRCHLFVRVALIYVHDRGRMGQYQDSILGSRPAERRYFAPVPVEIRVQDP